MRYAFVPVMWYLLLARPVCGDGTMMAKLGEADDLVETPKQEALIIVNEQVGNITVSLRTHFRAGPKNLAWIIPVPAVPGVIKKGNEDIFRVLEEKTAPKFYVFRSDDFKRGYGRPGGQPTAVETAIEVVKTGTAGILDYEVLKSTGTEALVDWFNKNGYRIPDGSEPVFQRYVDLGWHWLAVRLRAEVADEPDVVPHPITYTYRDDEVEYPIVISSLSAPDEIELVLYVLADREYGGENWANMFVKHEQLELDESSPSGTNYERLFRERTTEEGGHLLVTEFAGGIDDSPLLYKLRGVEVAPDLPRLASLGQPSRLTRLRAVIKKEALDRDIVLVPMGGYVPNWYHLSSHEHPESTWRLWPWAVVVVLVLAATYYSARRRRVNRQGAKWGHH